MTENEKRQLQSVASRLSTIPESSRKLLAQIIELAAEGRGGERPPDTAYLPELHESCGLDVEAMYATLGPLQTAGLVQMENQYPFEDIKLSTADGPAFLSVARICRQKSIGLQEVIGHSRFELLE